MVNWRKKHCFFGTEKACLSHSNQYLIAATVVFPSLTPRGEEERICVPSTLKSCDTRSQFLCLSKRLC